MEDIQRFIAGFRTFQKEYFGPSDSVFDILKHGQRPRTMIIGCSDSRVDPAILTGCGPGELFIVRNVANLVPPYESDGGHHGVSAAVEYGVCVLEVEHLVVLGHSSCGGIQALMEGPGTAAGAAAGPGAGKGTGARGGGFLAGWIEMAAPVREKVRQELRAKSPALQRKAAEEAAILLSLENLHSFPFVADRVEAGSLSLHGWYFDMEKGELSGYDAESSMFVPL